MSQPTDRVLSRTFKVGERYTCRLTMPVDATPGVRMATAEWEPTRPSVLTRHELRAYRKGRDALFAEAAELMRVAE